MSSKRIEWLDIAKGLGMIFVILGHAVGFGTPPHNIIFAFHMPLFSCCQDLFINRVN